MLNSLTTKAPAEPAPITNTLLKFLFLIAVLKIIARLNILQLNLRPLQETIINIADKVVTIIGILFVDTNDNIAFNT